MSVCSEAKYSCILKHDNLEAIKRCFVLIKNCNNPHTAHVQQCAHYTVMRYADNLSDRKLSHCQSISKGLFGVFNSSKNRMKTIQSEVL